MLGHRNGTNLRWHLCNYEEMECSNNWVFLKRESTFQTLFSLGVKRPPQRAQGLAYKFACVARERDEYYRIFFYSSCRVTIVQTCGDASITSP